MSLTTVTSLGRMIALRSDSRSFYWCVEMPCGDWERLGDEQLRGKSSVAHDRSCRAIPRCTYHETHDFYAALPERVRDWIDHGYVPFPTELVTAEAPASTPSSPGRQEEGERE